MQGITGTVQFAQFPGMTGTIYFNPGDLRRIMGVTGSTDCTEMTRESCSRGVTGSTGMTREYWGSTGSTGNRYVNVNYTVNANTSGKVVTEITF
jgi:hypothetical protein